MLDFINQITPFVIFWTPIIIVQIKTERRLTRLETKMDYYFNGDVKKGECEDVEKPII